MKVGYKRFFFGCFDKLEESEQAWLQGFWIGASVATVTFILCIICTYLILTS